MAQEAQRVLIENLPITSDNRLRVELVPLPAGNDPWRTRADYEREQRRDTIRFWVTIASLAVSIVGVVATAAVAIWTIRGLS
jgi:hypothetical protein